jgi:hypothetical protein
MLLLRYFDDKFIPNLCLYNMANRFPGLLLGVAFELERVPEVDGEVRDDEEGDEMLPGTYLLTLGVVAAPAQAVHDHGGLDENLNDLTKRKKKMFLIVQRI